MALMHAQISMAKIKISTVRQLTDVQVIYVNASLITRAVKAQVFLNQCRADIEKNEVRPLSPEEKMLCDFIDELVAAFEDDDEQPQQ